MNKVLQIAKVNLLDVFRDLKSNGIVFILPTVFMIVFGFLFNQVNEVQSWDIGYIEAENAVFSFAEIVEMANDANGEEFLLLQEFEGDNEAVEALENRDIDLLVEIGDKGQLKFTIDETNQRSAIAGVIIKDLLTPKDSQQSIKYENVSGRDNISGFELQSSGLIIYGILIMIPQVAGALGRLQEKKYIFRYSTTQVGAFHILAGFTLSHLVIGLIQTVLLFYVATWFGLGLDLQTLKALVFVIPVIIFAIGVGLLIGSNAVNSDSGQNIGTILSIILGFLSGSFIVGIDKIGFTFRDIFFAITDIIPTYYAYNGMTNLIIFRKDFSDVYVDLLLVIGFAFLIFIFGVYAFSKKLRT